MTVQVDIESSTWEAFLHGTPLPTSVWQEVERKMTERKA
jgi:hypothetical protein